MTKKKLPRIAVCGAGYWGKNHIKHFHALGVLKAICESNEKELAHLKALYPDVLPYSSFTELLKNPDIDAVSIAVPTPKHFLTAKEALLAKKHVFVEKPITLKASQALTLLKLAKKQKKKLMVGHLLLYHPAIQAMRDLIRSKTLGKVLYMYTQRLNLGQIRRDENAMWSLAPHDISILLDLFKSKPISVSARGHSYIQTKRGIEDVIFMHFTFADGVAAHIHLSWLDPHKVRKITLVGSKKMVVFDDMESVEKVRLFDKGADYSDDGSMPSGPIPIRVGEASIVPIDKTEPLHAECAHFIDCIQNNKKPLSDGENGYAVLQLLEASNKSLKSNGKIVRV